METGLLQTGLLLQALVDYYEKTGMKKEEEFFIYLKENNISIKTVRLFDHNNAELSLWAVFEGKDKEFIDLIDFKKILEPIVDLF